jgi:hypothetical protein
MPAQLRVGWGRKTIIHAVGVSVLIADGLCEGMYPGSLLQLRFA